MKTKNIWSIICGRIIVDEKTRLMSLIDVVEQFTLAIDAEKAPKEVRNRFEAGSFSEPIQVPNSSTVVSYWHIGETEREKNLKLETNIFDNKGKKISTNILPFKIPKDKKNFRSMVALPYFPVKGSGQYKIKSGIIEESGKIIATGITFVSVIISQKSKV